MNSKSGMLWNAVAHFRFLAPPCRLASYAGLIPREMDLAIQEITSHVLTVSCLHEFEAGRY